MRIKFIVYALVLLLAARMVATADAVDDFIKAEMQRQRIPGASIAVVRNGRIVKTEGYGVANLELNAPAAPETVFKIGSVSKQFLATGIMLLVADGKISLDDKIGKFLEGAPETWKEINIRHLLTHTSGIVREAPGFDPDKIQPDADVIKTAYSAPLNFAPGEKWEYCNVGYFTLAEIIHKASGKTWGDFLNERVFAPLGMTATRPTTVAEIVPQRAASYLLQNDKLVNADNWRTVRPSGAFLSNVLDLAKWEAALYDNKILSQSIKTQMWTPVALNSGKRHPYGFGWGLEDFRGASTIEHGGLLTGFRAQYTRFPEHGLTVIVLTNLGSANVSALANGIAVEYLPQLKLSALPAQSAPDAELTKTLKTSLETLASGAGEVAQATPELNAAVKNMPPANRQSIADRLKKLKSFDFLSRKDVADKKLQRVGADIASIWFYRLVTEDQTYYYTFYLTPDKKIAYFEGSLR